MTQFPVKSALALLLPAVLITGCGGSTGASVEPNTGAAISEPDNSQANNSSSGNTIQTPGTTDAAIPATPVATTPTVTNTVSGRVADGYLQGATVCVDINENSACDDDEPSSISGTGGTYQLDIPADATDKPIIADVPETAIDEDTGEAIGKKLILSTPADRPGFISPITTLVHEELKGNPNLTVEDAEGSVQQVLGITGEDRAGLFEDYVAKQKNNKDKSADEYRYLHETARVIATMMDGIQTQVEQAATENGLDFTTDQDTRKAMRELVRKEVKELLPDISLAVAAELQQNESAVTDLAGSEEPVLIDVAKVAENLERGKSQLDLVEKIDAIRGNVEAEKVAMKDLLSQGIYWLEVECDREDIHEGDNLESDAISPEQIILDDDGAPTLVDIPEHCFAEYGHITVEGLNNELVENTFEYDVSTGEWVAIYEDDSEQPLGLHLQDGEWVQASHEGPGGSVEFTEDGGAVLSTGLGKMLVYASSHALDNKPVAHHIFRRGGNNKFLSLLNGTQMFPEGSEAYTLFIKREGTAHVLFNWQPYEDESDCEAFNGNCNVVDVMDEAGFSPASSLDAIRELSVNGVSLTGIVYHHYEGRPVDIELSANNDSDNGLPEAGTALWFTPPDEFDTDNLEPGFEPAFEPAAYDCATEDQIAQQDPASFELPPCALVKVPDYCYSPDGEKQSQTFIDVVIFNDAQTVEGSAPVSPQFPADCPQHPEEITDANQQTEFRVQNDDAEYDKKDITKKRVLGKSKWKVITVDGVSMVEIEIPVPVKHSTDVDDLEALLLIEQSGYVRRGAKLLDVESEDALMYSLPAFETLQPVAEKYLAR